MADMLTWIVVALVALLFQALSLEETWMMLCVSRSGEFSARSSHQRSIFPFSVVVWRARSLCKSLSE
jgi:hypothetical protein